LRQMRYWAKQQVEEAQHRMVGRSPGDDDGAAMHAPHIPLYDLDTAAVEAALEKLRALNAARIAEANTRALPATSTFFASTARRSEARRQRLWMPPLLPSRPSPVRSVWTSVVVFQQTLLLHWQSCSDLAVATALGSIVLGTSAASYLAPSAGAVPLHGTASRSWLRRW
jgi:hypothetical protein